MLSRVDHDGVMMLADASADAELADSPWVNGDAGAIRFYAAIPLIGREGYPLGTICAWSAESAEVAEDQRVCLRVVRDAVMRHLDSRRDAAERAQDEPIVWTIGEVIERGAITSLFQPVVHIPTGEIVGFEALSRGPEGTRLESPTALLEAAREGGRVGELDRLCRTTAVRSAAEAGLPAELSWLINVEPAGMADAHGAPLCHEEAARSLRIVLEVVERGVEGHVLDLLHAAELARQDSCGIALDDVGAEQSSLALVPLLRPDIVKLDMSLLHGAPGRTAAAVTSAVRAYTERTRAVILAEGVETEEQEQLARVFGATYAQGYLYGPPAALPETLPVPRNPIAVRTPPLGDLTGTPFETLAQTRPPQVAAEDLLVHISRYLEDQSATELNASVLMAAFHGHRCSVVVADQTAFDGAAASLADEWFVLITKPHLCAALAARQLADGRYEYVYTHDEGAVARAAHAFAGVLLSARG
jgi:EAL domain-containing protein (putative c-di-GMP-specific phosphodiesterase class I)